MIQIHHITLTRAQLDTIPESERRLLILIAHAANELNIFSKLFHFSAMPASKIPILMQAENAQALVLGRVLTGKIYECWNLLQTAFFATALSRTYEPQFDAKSAEALSKLKNYFSRANIIATVRNKHAFHYSIDQIEAGYAALIEGDPLEIYLAKANANTLFSFADTIAGRAMLESINPEDHRAAFEMLIDETSEAVGLIVEVVSEIMSVCVKRYIGSSLYEMGAKIIEIEGSPNSQIVSIPYFIEIADEV